MIEIKNTERGFGKSLLSLAMAQSALAFLEEYKDKKYKRLNKLKGGNSTIETKSRYEVIAELEEKKRNLIINRDNLPGELQERQKELRDMKREVEDKEEEIKEFKEAMETQKTTINELIESTNDSLNRFADIGKKKS